MHLKNERRRRNKSEVSANHQVQPGDNYRSAHDGLLVVFLEGAQDRVDIGVGRLDLFLELGTG